MDKHKANTFKLIRLWRGLTMAQLSAEIGVSVPTITAVENGQRAATNEVRAAYARRYTLDDSYFAFVDAYTKTF